MSKIREFVKAHPIFSYILASTITGKICSMVVNVVRAITGKYPPAQTMNVNFPGLDKAKVDVAVKPADEETEEPEEEEETIETDTE